MAVSAVLIGAGQRGHYVYGRYGLDHPERLRFVAVIDPDEKRLDRFQAAHPHAVPFRDVAAWAEDGPNADIAIVASPDRHHHDGVLAALARRCHVLCEKPMAATPADTLAVAQAAVEADRLLAVAHVLRYTPFFSSLNAVVRSGRLGRLITVEHRENVSAFHMAHSFVRGNWAVAGRSTPMIVQKCCHDFDILVWNLQDPIRRLSSFGSLLEFRPEHAPPNATARCTDPCPVHDCPFDARRYLDQGWPADGWPLHVLTDDRSDHGRLAALRTGPYGRCVYTAGSDVVDHQVVAMETAAGVSVSLAMHGHSGEEGRTMRYDGSRATVRARFGRHQEIEVTDHRTGAVEPVPIEAAAGGHGGGDVGIVSSFLRAVATGTTPLTSAADSVESHVLAFAAEEARVSGQVIDLARYRSSI